MPLTRTPQTSDPVTIAGTVQDVFGLIAVALLVVVAALVLP